MVIKTARMMAHFDEALGHYEGKTVLVTGASGYLAGGIVAKLKDTTCKIVRLSRGALRPVQPCRAEFLDLSGDPGSPQFWKSVPTDVDVAFHLAGQTSVYEAERDPLGSLEANVVPMLNLLAYCKRLARPANVVFAGTVTEVGLTDHLPVNETAPDNPITVYDLHKLCAELHLQHDARMGTVFGTTLRLANIYGPAATASSGDRAVLNRIISAALAGQFVQVYGDGAYLRDYVFLDDAVAAFLLAGVKQEAVSGRHFVIASGEGHSFGEAFRMVAERVEEATRRSVKVVHVDWPENSSPIEFRNFVGDSTAFREATGWQPKTTLRQGIDRTVAEAVRVEG